MKKALALILALVMMLALSACGSSSAPAATPAPTPAPTEEPKAEELKSYQLVGVYAEEGQGAAQMTAAFMVNLNEDGTAVVDRYRYLTYDVSDFAANTGYDVDFMKGTWKPVQKDGIDCLQVKLAVENADGTTSNDQTAYAYEIAGTYSFDLTFPIVPGMSYSRTTTLEGGETKQFADGNALIAAYAAEPELPESIAQFTTEDNSGTVYLQADGTALFYVGYDKAAEGTWSAADGALTLNLGGEDVAVTVDGNAASAAYSRDRGDGQMVDYALSCADISALASAEAPAEEPAAEGEAAPAEETAEGEANAEAAPAEEAAPANVYSMPLNLAGNETTLTVELIDDTTAKMTAFMGFDCTYEKIGSAVVLTPVEEPAETKGQIWGAVKHAFLLNEEDKSLTALEGAYKAGELAFYLLDETNMKAEYPAYSFGKEGFTYTLADGVLKVTAPDADALGAFAQVWDAMGAAEWTVDGNTVTAVAAEEAPAEEAEAK
ncbi:MAG: hypothetical protein IJK38_00745 [Oscillospiraceae bacterium]|nr:hypothetical protein [Oscillospiraceae bacterium]